MLPVLLDCLPDLVVLADPTSRLHTINPAAREFLGARGAVGMPVEELLNTVAPGLSERRREGLRSVVANGGDWRGPIELTDLTGERQQFNCIVAARPEGLLLIAQEAAEARAREAADRELAARDEFVARLGHELRTPLNAVLGFAQLLELEDLPAEQRDDIERILTAGRHMQSLLDEVLDLARVRTGGVDLDVGPVPVLDVVRGVVDLVEPLAGRRAIRSYLEPAAELVALADRRRLWQVLLNLIGNAVKYGREGGTMRVGVLSVGDEAGDRLRIEVEDDGPGIEPAALERLFRPFERLGQERTAVEGTGLGLAMSQALVHAMGGELTASSRLGSGSLFTVELPGVDVHELTEPPETDAPRVVVYVTNDPGGQALVASALRQRLRVEVVTVQRAALALETVRQRQPSLVLLDAELPDAPATELLHRLGGDPLSALVPKVVLSFDPDPALRLRLRAAGAHDVLTLPLDVRLLLETVLRLLKRS